MNVVQKKPSRERKLPITIIILLIAFLLITLALGIYFFGFSQEGRLFLGLKPMVQSPNKQRLDQEQATANLVDGSRVREQDSDSEQAITEYEVQVSEKETVSPNSTDEAIDYNVGRIDLTDYPNKIAAEIKVLDYTKEIDNICQDFQVSFLFKLLETGEPFLAEALFVQDDFFGDQARFLFDLVSDDIETEQAFLFRLSQDGILINDFSYVNPGDEVKLVVSAKRKIDYFLQNGEGGGVRWENPFDVVDANGTYNLRIETGVYRPGRSLIFGKSDAFPVAVNIYSESDVLKPCQ